MKIKNLIKNIFGLKNKKNNKPTIIFATPPRNNKKSTSPQFQIGDSSKIKNELENTKDKLEEISDQNKTLSANSEKYITEKSKAGKSKAGKSRHQKTEIIKTQIIKHMFNNRELIKGISTKQRADKISKELTTVFYQESDNYNKEQLINNFAKKYHLDLNILKSSKDYFQDNKSDTIYRWCLKFSK
jgi:hypothetical protein